MANKRISEMDLPKSIGHILAARNIITAKDALSLTEFELMELLDVGLGQVKLAVALISEITSPRYQTVQSLLEQRIQNEYLMGHLPTHLKGLDAALCGGLPFGALTELVGPSGIGKTQFCLKISILAALPACYGGLDGHVIYIDVESKFSSKRLIEIGINSFPEIFCLEGMAKEMAGRITVLRPGSLTEFTESLQEIKVLVLQHQVKLLIIDSMAALVSGEYEQGPQRQHPLGWHISFIKSLAEFSRIPVVMTNQVRSRGGNQIPQYIFQAGWLHLQPKWKPSVSWFKNASNEPTLNFETSVNQSYPVALEIIFYIGFFIAFAVKLPDPLEVLTKQHANPKKRIVSPPKMTSPVGERIKYLPLINTLHAAESSVEDNTEKFDSRLVAALGIHWAHAVNIRLVLESRSGQRFIKVAKSPMSPPLAFPFQVTSMGIILLNDDGVEMAGSQINTIDHQGHSDIIFHGDER